MRWTFLSWIAASALLLLGVYLRLHPPQEAEVSRQAPAIEVNREAPPIEKRYKARIEFSDGTIRAGDVQLIARVAPHYYSVLWEADGYVTLAGIGL